MNVVTPAEAQVFCLAPAGVEANVYEGPIAEAHSAVEAHLGYRVTSDCPSPVRLAILLMVNGRDLEFVKPWLKPYMEKN